MAVAAGIILPLLVLLSSDSKVPLVCVGQKQPAHDPVGRHHEERGAGGGGGIARALEGFAWHYVTSLEEQHEAAAAGDEDADAGHSVTEEIESAASEAADDVEKAATEAAAAESAGAAAEQAAEQGEPGAAAEQAAEHGEPGGHSEDEVDVADEEGSGSHGHGEGHGSDTSNAHGHEHKRGWRNEFTIAFMLLGFVGFNMALFYLVNWHDPDIRENSWKIISGTISIFCAVLTFQSLQSIAEDILRNPVLNQMLLFFLLWFLVQALLYIFRSNPFPLKAFGTIGGHIVGFAALHAFGAVQSMEPYKGNLFLALLPLVAYVPTALLLMLIAYWFRNRVALWDDGEVDGDEKRWIEQCEDTENDAWALGVSFLLVGTVQFLVLGEVPEMHGDDHKGLDKGISMSLAGVAFLLVVALIAIVLHNLRRRCPIIHEIHRSDDEEEIPMKKHLAMRTVHIVMDTAGLSMAWCFLSGGKLLLGETRLADREMMADLALSLLFSVGAMGMIFVLDWLADNRYMPEKALRGMIVALSLLVGLAWESCFKVAVDDVADVIGGTHPAIGKYTKLLIAVVLVGVVLPAWRLYILPQSDPELAKTYRGGQPPLRPPALMALCYGRSWQVTHPDELPVLEKPGGAPSGKTVSTGATLFIEQERICNDVLYLKIKNSGWVAERDQQGRAVCILTDTGEIENRDDSSSGSEDANDSQSDDYKSDDTTRPII